jgi:hypothetical protein
MGFYRKLMPGVSWNAVTGISGMENMRLEFTPIPEFETGSYSFSEI